MKKSRKKEIDSDAIVSMRSSTDENDTQSVIHHNDIENNTNNNNNSNDNNNNNNNGSKNLVNNTGIQANGSVRYATTANETIVVNANDGHSANESANDVRICDGCELHAKEDVIKYVDSSSVSSDHVDAHRIIEHGDNNSECTTSKNAVKLTNSHHDEIEMKQLNDRQNRVRNIH